MDLLKSILDNSAHLLVVLDCETARVADCNEAQCRASGRSREELVGKAAGELHLSFPLQTAEQWSYFTGRVEAEPGLTIDTQYRRGDGSFYPVRTECFPHEVEGRRYILVAARQMTGGQAIVQSRYEREARWQKALNQMASHPANIAGRFYEAALFIAATGKSVFPADKCSIWRVDADRAQFLADDRGSVRASRAEPVELSEFPWLEKAMILGRCTDFFEAFETPGERERTRALAAAYDVKAALCAPVRVAGRNWGAVTVASRSDRQWQPEEIGFAGEIADQIANAVASAERRRIEEELIASEERYRSFIEMSAEAVWRVEFTEPIALDLSIEEQAAAVIARGYIADCNQAFAAFFYGDRKTFYQYQYQLPKG